MSAVSGRELLPMTCFPCAKIVDSILAALGSRASRPVMLFHNGEIANQDFQVASDAHVELAAVVVDAVTPEDRDRFLQALEHWEGSPHMQSATIFEKFSEAARDDKEIVLAAVNNDSFCLRFVSEILKHDKDVVLAAVRQRGLGLLFAGEGLKDNREIVLTAVQHEGRALEWAGHTCKNDKEIVLAAAQEDSRCSQLGVL